MSRTSTYLNFNGNTEEAFEFYRTVFKTEFSEPIRRFKDLPQPEGAPPLPTSLANLVMHVALPILGGHLLRGTDAPEEMGFRLDPGNQIYIQLEPDSREEAQRLFHLLAYGGHVETPLSDMPWGSYFGTCVDRFGIHWMVQV
jgi:PhnB protein